MSSTGVAGSLAGALLAMVCAGCPQPATPASVAQRYLEALAAGDAVVAHRLLTPELRRAVGFAEIERRLDAMSASERRAFEERAANLGPGRPVATWTLQNGATMALEHRGGTTWVVTGRLPRLDRQDTPRQALQTFARAFRSNDYRALLPLIPLAERIDLNESKLAAGLGDPALRDEVTGALRALLDAGAGEAAGEDGWVFRAGRHRAVLKNEGGSWRLVDLR